MKNLIIILALAFSGFISAQEINWMSLEEAVVMQKKSPKKNNDGCLYQLVWTM